MPNGKIHLPRPIYEAIPFVYGIAGTLFFMGIEFVSPKVIGALMFIAACHILNMRVRNRFLQTPKPQEYQVHPIYYEQHHHSRKYQQYHDQ